MARPSLEQATHMYSILLIASESRGARLKSDLEYIGYTVSHLNLRGNATALTDPEGQNSIDLIVMEPDLDRLAEDIRRVRKSEQVRNTPLIVLTDEMTANNLDFSLGIDDFVVSPYSLREVEARLRLALWHEDMPDDKQTLRADDLTINLQRYEVRVKGSVIDLTLKEYELLKHLVTHRGRVFTRSDLLDNIWGYDYYGGMRTVDVHVRRLRSKLGDVGQSIATVRGVGYRFDFLQSRTRAAI